MVLPLFVPVDPWTNLIQICSDQDAAVDASNLPTAEKTRLKALIAADLVVYQAAQAGYVTAIEALIGGGGGGTIGGSITSGQVAFGDTTANNIDGSNNLTFSNASGLVETLSAGGHHGLSITQSSASSVASARVNLVNDVGNSVLLEQQSNAAGDLSKLTAGGALEIDGPTSINLVTPSLLLNGSPFGGGSGGLARQFIANKTGNFSASSVAFAATPMSATIAGCASATSQVVLQVSFGVCPQTIATPDTLQITIFRDGVNLAATDTAMAGFNTNSGDATTSMRQVNFTWVDTPGDTAPHTYAVYMSTGTTLDTYQINTNGSGFSQHSYFTATEFAT